MENDIIGSPVHVLILDSRYGQTVSVHTTYRQAIETVGNWVEMVWDLSPGIPMTREGDTIETIEQKLSEYFDFYEGENYSITSTRIAG
jgi:hypothetical protein